MHISTQAKVAKNARGLQKMAIVYRIIARIDQVTGKPDVS